MRKASITHTFLLICALSYCVTTIRAAVPRPFLYPNPEQPGPDPFGEMRAKMRDQFDANQNGRLDPAEREAMRRATRKIAEDRSAWVRRVSKEEGDSRRPPDRWLKLYDRDGDKRLEGSEWETARKAEVQRVTALFDTNQNGQIESQEKSAIRARVKENTLNGYDAYIHREVSGDNRRGRNRSRDEGSPEERWQAFDQDGDGKASWEELQAIRAHEAGNTSN